MKSVINLMKLILFRVKLMEDVNLLLDQMSEKTFIVNVLALILSEFFVRNKQNWYVSYGEICLKASTKDSNSQKADDQHQSFGKKIDTIISLREDDEEFSMTEVSGPPAVNDWSHFKGDHMKITKMLKTLINQFAELNSSSDISCTDYRQAYCKFWLTLLYLLLLLSCNTNSWNIQ